jgi:hypothetical protein
MWICETSVEWKEHKTIDTNASLNDSKQEPALRTAVEQVEQNDSRFALFKCPVRLSLNITR